jgi:hypothetical protein
MHPLRLGALMAEVVKLDGFACNCRDRAPNMAALRTEVCETLKCEPDQLVSTVVYKLWWDHSVAITGIPCDMWSAVKSEHRRYVTDEEWEALPEDAPGEDEWVLVASAYIQCDRIEDGFALTWKVWQDWFKQKEATP